MASKIVFLLFLPLLLFANPRILNVSFENSAIVLDFDRPVSEKQTKFLHLSGSGLRKNIYDIHAELTTKARSKQLSGNIKVKIAQNNRQKVRVVFFSPAKFYTKSYYQGKRLIIKSRPSGSKEFKDSPGHKPSKQPKPEAPRLRKTVVIDPGHGGKDCGTMGRTNHCEKHIVLYIGQTIAQELRSYGINAHLTRDSDRFIRLKNRTSMANDKQADVFVSIHVNAIAKKSAHKLHGVETYFLSPARSTRAKNVAALENSEDIEDMNYFSKQTFLNFLNSTRMIESNKLAIDVQKNVLLSARERYTDVKDGGVREGPFWVLVGAQMPSVLIETGYLSHPTESKRLLDKKYQVLLAQGIAKGIYSYFKNNP